MDFIPYLLLVLPAVAVVIKAMEIDEDYTDETPTDRRETHLDRCIKLTKKELPSDLHTLALKKCSLNKLDAIDFNEVANLSVLQLRDGTLYKLKGEMFAKLPQLQILELQNNYINNVHFDAFVGLSQLWMLALNQNDLVFLNGSVFRPLTELRHLDLSGNRLFALATIIFSGNLKLEILLLRDNPFMVLWLSTFFDLKNLVLLDMRNSGRYTDLELFSAQTMIVTNQKLTRLEILGEVSTLQAPNNKLEHVRLEVKATVTELDLHDNSLDNYVISELLRGMWRLQILDFSQNLVTELPVFKPRDAGDVFLLPQLKFVNLSRNRLEYLHQGSPLLSPCLTHLDVSYNRIHGIGAHTFGMAENLQYLYLQFNLISHFRPDRLINQQQGLKKLAFYGNPLDIDRLCQIANSFKKAGVKVLEEESLAPHCQKEPLELHTSRKWSTWNALILLGLLASLTLDVFLILQLRRSRALRYWRKNQSSRVKAKFVRSEGSEILI